MIGKEIQNYRILKELGKGGMGIVYKANQLSLRRMVAVKVLPRHLTNDSSFIKRFKNEARAIAKLNHPNIVQIYDVGNEGKIYYYTMEFIEGPALDEIIQKEGVIPVDRAISIVGQVANALQYAHSQGIVHRDIKPSNIMITKSGRAKVTDFGLALQKQVARLTVAGDIVGTPEYMSPEQSVGQQATVRSDIYSLGVVCYEMLTGKVPFEGDSPLMVLNKIKASELQWPCAINPDIPFEVEKLIRKMMAKNPRDRYASCQQLIQDIQRLKANQMIPIRTKRRLAFRRLTMGTFALVLLGFIATVSTVLIKRHNQTNHPLVNNFLQLSEKLDFTKVDELAAIKLSPPRLSRPDVLDNIRQKLALLEEQLKGLRTQYKEKSAPAYKDMLIKMKQKFTLIEDQVINLRASMYADTLLLEQGTEVRGRITDESLEKIYIRTSLGSKTEIDRNRIRFTVYATENQRKFSQTLVAELPEIENILENLRKNLAALEKEPKRLDELDGIKALDDNEREKKLDWSQPAESLETGDEAALSIPLDEKNWEAFYDCDEGAKCSFDNNTVYISTNDLTGNSSCVVSVSTTIPIEGVPNSIEILTKVQQETSSRNGRARSSVAITFADGRTFDYCFFDSQADQATAEASEDGDRFIIRRPGSLILPDEDWQTLTFPLAEDAAKTGENTKIEAISLIHRHSGRNTGFFVSSFKSIIVNMQKPTTGPS